MRADGVGNGRSCMLKRRFSWAPLGDRQRGMSIVEMMVGTAIGLVIVAGSSLVVSTQLGENRKLLQEAQLQQDLRAAADIVARELRRASFMTDAYRTVWYPATSGIRGNVYPDVAISGSTINFAYERGPGQHGPYGFRLSGGVIQTRLADAGWQELTDSRAVQVTQFDITPNVISTTVLPCPKACPVGGPTDCWPKLVQREFKVEIKANAVGDANIVRKHTSVVRVRNDWVQFRDVVNPLLICPA